MAPTEVRVARPEWWWGLPPHYPRLVNGQRRCKQYASSSLAGWLLLLRYHGRCSCPAYIQKSANVDLNYFNDVNDNVI